MVTFRTHGDRRPSKSIVLADNMGAAINMAWEHGSVRHHATELGWRVIEHIWHDEKMRIPDGAPTGTNPIAA